MYYKVEVAASIDSKILLKVGFGEPAQNDAIVQEARVSFKKMKENCLAHHVFVNGPASLPVAMCMAHELGHAAKSILCYDPKLNKYICAISHDNAYAVGYAYDFETVYSKL